MGNRRLRRFWQIWGRLPPAGLPVCFTTKRTRNHNEHKGRRRRRGRAVRARKAHVRPGGPVGAWRASHAMLWGGGGADAPTTRHGAFRRCRRFRRYRSATDAALYNGLFVARLSRVLFSVLRSPGHVSAPPPAGAWGSTPHLSNQLINKFPLCLFVVLRVLRVFLKTFHFCSSPRPSPRRGVLFSVAVEGLALWACTLCSPFSGRRRRPSFRLAKGAGKVVF